jgi:hypothetical protein
MPGIFQILNTLAFLIFQFRDELEKLEIFQYQFWKLQSKPRRENPCVLLKELLNQEPAVLNRNQR